jgi:hypothetical protein
MHLLANLYTIYVVLQKSRWSAQSKLNLTYLPGGRFQQGVVDGVIWLTSFMTSQIILNM